MKQEERQSRFLNYIESGLELGDRKINVYGLTGGISMSVENINITVKERYNKTLLIVVKFATNEEEFLLRCPLTQTPYNIFNEFSNLIKDKIRYNIYKEGRIDNLNEDYKMNGLENLI